MLLQRGKLYSQDLRERVFASADDGKPVGRECQIGRLPRVSASYVSKILSRRRQAGQTKALAQRCHVPPEMANLHDAIRRQITTCPDTTIPKCGHS